MATVQQITNYSLLSYRALVGGQGNVVRTTILSVEPQTQGVSDVVLLYYPGNGIGRVAAPSVYVHFPEELFLLHSRIFRTEQPLFVSWDADAQGQLTVIQFRTVEEWPGEGPADQSP
jgi:hypothetical protein